MISLRDMEIDPEDVKAEIAAVKVAFAQVRDTDVLRARHAGPPTRCSYTVAMYSQNSRHINSIV